MGERPGFGSRDSGVGNPPRAHLLGARKRRTCALRQGLHRAQHDALLTDSRFPTPDSRPRRHPRHAGFTLLEVLIALLILSLVLVALIRAAGLQAQALTHHRDSTLAQWVAANVAAELRAQGAPPVGRQQGEMRMGPKRWRWQAETSDTDVERVRRMEITVFAAESESLAGSDADPVARLTAFATP
jgi:type II secretion system protein I